jgi:hypothetical protein
VSRLSVLRLEHSGGLSEIAGDELTVGEIAATFGAHVGLSARYEAQVEVLNGQDDLQSVTAG